MQPAQYPTQIPTIATDRLLLRPFTPADAQRVRLLAGDREIAETTLHIPHPYPEGAAEGWIATHAGQAAEGKNYAFAVALRESGELIGCIGIGPDQANSRAEIGYWFGRPFWGKGYATESARAVLRFGFEDLGLNCIHAAFFTTNPASGKVQAKLGMTFEGVRRQVHVKWGKFVDLGYYSILRSEWEAGLKSVQPIAMQPIATVRNGQTEPVDEGWGEVTSELLLRPDLATIADGLEGFSHALVIYYMHQTPAVPELKRRPRGRADMPELGLLAQRARHRPNPIGITAVEVVAVAPDRVTVRGLDAIDGTPVLDIKPYFPDFDRRDEATVPEWVGRLMTDYFDRKR